MAMTREAYLLTVLAEECAEVIQRVSKALRFGLTEVQPGQDKSNERRLCDEVEDLLGVIEMLEDEMVVCPTERGVKAKRGKIKAYMAYSRERGTLE